MTNQRNSDGTIGVTMTPGAPPEANPSVDDDVHIVVSGLLPNSSEKAMTLTHEAYGHAYFYELKRNGINVNPFHDRKGAPPESVKYEYDPILKMYLLDTTTTFKEMNTTLDNAIKRAQQETMVNQSMHNR